MQVGLPYRVGLLAALGTLASCQTPRIAGSTNLDASAPFAVKADAAKKVDLEVLLENRGPESFSVEVLGPQPEAPREIAAGSAWRWQRSTSTFEARVTTSRRTHLAYRVYASGSVSLSTGTGN